jgi:hypothetical protein
MTEIETPRARRRGRLLVPLLVAALVLAGVLVTFRVVQRPPAFADGRSALTGKELIGILGPSVARQGSGRMEQRWTNEDRLHGVIDFVIHDGVVDFVADQQGERSLVVKHGMLAARDLPPVPVATPGVNSRGDANFLAGLAPEWMKTETFQQVGEGELNLLSPEAVFTRQGTTDDGSSVWTASWASPTSQGERKDARLTVDAAGLPSELRVTLVRAPDSLSQGFTSILTYSRWGQAVQIPEPTFFGTLPPAPEDGPP